MRDWDQVCNGFLLTERLSIQELQGGAFRALVESPRV